MGEGFSKPAFFNPFNTEFDSNNPSKVTFSFIATSPVLIFSSYLCATFDIMLRYCFRILKQYQTNMLHSDYQVCLTSCDDHVINIHKLFVTAMTMFCYWLKKKLVSLKYHDDRQVLVSLFELISLKITCWFYFLSFVSHIVSSAMRICNNGFDWMKDFWHVCENRHCHLWYVCDTRYDCNLDNVQVKWTEKQFLHDFDYGKNCSSGCWMFFSEVHSLVNHRLMHFTGRL